MCENSHKHTHPPSLLERGIGGEVKSQEKGGIFRLPLFVCMFCFLSSCAPVADRQARVRAWWAGLSETASGALTTTRQTVEGTVEAGKRVIEVGRQAASGAQATAKELQERAAKVKTGVERIQEGKKLIEEGVGR